jgi:hypothetical protein
MINKINKERLRSMNAIPLRSSNKNHWQGAQADPKQKQAGHKTTDRPLKNNIPLFFEGGRGHSNTISLKAFKPIAKGGKLFEVSNFDHIATKPVFLMECVRWRGEK